MATVNGACPACGQVIRITEGVMENHWPVVLGGQLCPASGENYDDYEPVAHERSDVLDVPGDGLSDGGRPDDDPPIIINPADIE